MNKVFACHASDSRSDVGRPPPLHLDSFQVIKHEMGQGVATSLAQTRFSSFLLMAFAELALVLSAVGIYGVMSHAVSQRTSEIGIRLALGAAGKDILKLIVSDGARLAAIGLGIGILLAVGLSRTLTSLLFQTMPTDPLTYVLVITVLGLVALLASYVPARRAAAVDPVETLTAE